MKYCEQCAAKLRNDAEFCYQCGAPCEDIRDRVLYEDRLAAWRREEKNRRRESSGGSFGKIVLTALLVMLLVALMVYAWISPARRSYDLAVNGETAAAQQLYVERVTGSAFESFLLRCMIPRGAEAVLSAYEEGGLSYQDASARLKTLSVLEAPLTNAGRTAERLESLYKSGQAYSLAQSYEAEGDYRSAMLSYRMVTDTDGSYSDASQKAAEAEEKYRSSVLASVGVPETEKEYREAVRILEDALAVLPGDETLSAAQTTLRQTFAVRIKEAAVPKAQEYIAEGYYKQAIDLVNRALVYNEQDMDLKTLLRTATADYEDFVRSQVNIYLGNGDKEGALSLLERVRADLPGDAVFEQLYQTVTAS